MRICIVTGLLIPALAFAETATDNSCPTLVSAAFTTAVEEREPLAQLTTAPLSVNELLFFTAIQDGNGEQLHHTWSYNGEPIVDVPLAVGSDYWRTWSSKTFAGLDLAVGGQWQVQVSTQSGCQLGTWTLTLSEDGAASQMAPAHARPPAPSGHAEPESADPSPVDLSENYAVIRQLLDLGDTRAAKVAIRRARQLTANPQQLAELDTLAADNEAFAQLDKLIRQRDVHGARELMQTLVISISPDSPVYPALQSRHGGGAFFSLLSISAPTSATEKAPEKPVPPVRMVPTVSSSPVEACASPWLSARTAAAVSRTGADGCGADGGVAASATGRSSHSAPACFSTARNFMAVAWSASFFNTTGCPENNFSTRAASILKIFPRLLFTVARSDPFTS